MSCPVVTGLFPPSPQPGSGESMEQPVQMTWRSATCGCLLGREDVMSHVGPTTETQAERVGSALAAAQRMKKDVMGSFGEVTGANPTALRRIPLAITGWIRATHLLQNLETVQRCFVASAGPSLIGHGNWETGEDQVLLFNPPIPCNAVDPGR